MTLDRLSDAPWRVRLSDSRPGLAHLSLTDHRLTVTRDALDAAVDTARSIGATHVRTSALSDASVPLLSEAGFVDVDRLVLLQRRIVPSEHVHVPDRDPSENRVSNGEQGQPNPQPVQLRRLTRRHLESAAQIDEAAFGSAWAIDRDGLADVLTATPVTWGRRATFGPSRWWRAREPMVGFVLCGASGTDAYIQRLAVNPAVQRRGVAFTLVSAALEWMSAHGSTNVLVNTRPDNVAALTLYERCGFQRLSQQLIVAERSL